MSFDLVQTKGFAKIFNVLCVGWDLGIERHEVARHVRAAGRQME